MSYDLTLKTLFASPPRRLIEHLLGARLAIAEQLNVEYPEVRVRRADLVVRLADGRLLHLELQSFSEDISWRELDYYRLIHTTYGQPPIQIVLYVGSGPMRIPSGIEEENLKFRYRVVDIREVEAEALLGSESLEDNLLAILCRLTDGRQAVRRILRRVAELPPSERQDAVAKLLILSGLRGMTETVREEVAAMPITLDIEENPFLRELYQKARREGEREGELRGEQRGELRGELRGEQRGELRGEQRGQLRGERILLRRQLERRFGTLPGWTMERIESAESALLESWGLRLLEAGSLEEVFR